MHGLHTGKAIKSLDQALHMGRPRFFQAPHVWTSAFAGRMEVSFEFTGAVNGNVTLICSSASKSELTFMRDGAAQPVADS